MSNKHDLLFEIGCEELPSGSLEKLSIALADTITKIFAEAGLTHEGIQTFATPRRLAVLVPNLDEQQPSSEIERLGPSYDKAFDKSGTPTLACIGFARSCNTTVEDLEIKETDKGKRVRCNVKHVGANTREILPELINKALKKLPLPKTMRWGDHKMSFIRPVHWVVLLYGDNLVEAEILGVKTSRGTRGHRFMHSGVLNITHPNDYNALLYSDGNVIADFRTRKETIRKLIQQQTPANCAAIINGNLLNEVTSLVEWPVALLGSFSTAFLKVPKEALITSMETHQKCFALENERGELQPHFILISNIESKDPQTVIQGNERVINARLNDAQFFYFNDLKHTLESRLDKLDHVVFQHKLGTLGDKTKRITKLARSIASAINEDADTAARAALLCKCDLVSEMVYEFPSLQGIMGHYYALNDGEPEACAQAIYEHYQPKSSGAKLPLSLVGATVSLADRLDTLVGIIGINQLPTGDKDPFGLRRAAHGIFRILIEKEIPLDLVELLQQTYDNFAIELANKDTVSQTFDFIIERMKYWYIEQGVSVEVFEAVNANRPTAPHDFHHRVLAVRQFQTLPEAGALAAANKRVSNILRKQTKDVIPADTDDSLFEFDEERTLAHELSIQFEAVNDLYEKTEYTRALSQLSTLKEPIDAFFDQVMIMVDDDDKRKNRLALLARLRSLFSQVADISLLPS